MNDQPEARPAQVDPDLSAEESARREFLRKAGRFATVTPPAMAFLLGTTLSSRAIAASSGTRPGFGWGDKNHSHTGPARRKR